MSATKPSARNTTSRGISVRMYGRVTRITPGWPLEPAECISRAMQLDAALAPLSGDDRHSATHMYLLGWRFSKTYTWLVLIFSCAMRTFSDPLMMK